MSETILDKLTQECSSCKGKGGEDCDEHDCSTRWHTCGRCNGTKRELKPKYHEFEKWLDAKYKRRY